MGNASGSSVVLSVLGRQEGAPAYLLSCLTGEFCAEQDSLAPCPAVLSCVQAFRAEGGLGEKAGVDPHSAAAEGVSSSAILTGRFLLEGDGSPTHAWWPP